METIQFIKVHGSGNDFILIDEAKLPVILSYEDKKKLTVMLCDRSSGIGADGILFVSVGGTADGVMRIFNSDGSEASMCGNGLRAAGRYILEKTGKDEAIVNTLKADLYVKKYYENEHKQPLYQVEISPVLFDTKALPMETDKEKIINEELPYLSEQLKFSAVAVPNPHLISVVTKEQLLSGVQEKIAQFVNGENPYFPDGVNVSFVYPIQDGEIFVNTFERGVGFTNACGTAMSASSLIAILNGLHDYEKPLVVYNNGGYVNTIVHRNEDKIWIDLIGNGTYVFDGEVKVNFENWSISDWKQTSYYEEEEKQYQEIEQKATDKIKSLFGKEKV